MFRTICVAAIALATAAPALAQSADPQMRQKAEAIQAKWETALNAADAKTIEALLSPNAVTINAFGVFTGAAAEQDLQRMKQMGINLKSQVTDVQPLGGGIEALSIGTYEVSFSNPSSQARGNFMQVLERQGSDWKIRAMSLARMAPASPATATGPASAQPATGSTTPPATGTTK